MFCSRNHFYLEDFTLFIIFNCQSSHPRNTDISYLLWGGGPGALGDESPMALNSKLRKRFCSFLEGYSRELPDNENFLSLFVLSPNHCQHR